MFEIKEIVQRSTMTEDGGVMVLQGDGTVVGPGMEGSRIQTCKILKQERALPTTFPTLLVLWPCN